MQQCISLDFPEFAALPTLAFDVEAHGKMREWHLCKRHWKGSRLWRWHWKLYTNDCVHLISFVLCASCIHVNTRFGRLNTLHSTRAERNVDAFFFVCRICRNESNLHMNISKYLKYSGSEMGGIARPLGRWLCASTDLSLVANQGEFLSLFAKLLHNLFVYIMYVSHSLIIRAELAR